MIWKRVRTAQSQGLMGSACILVLCNIHAVFKLILYMMDEQLLNWWIAREYDWHTSTFFLFFPPLRTSAKIFQIELAIPKTGLCLCDAKFPNSHSMSKPDLANTHFAQSRLIKKFNQNFKFLFVYLVTLVSQQLSRRKLNLSPLDRTRKRREIVFRPNRSKKQYKLLTRW